MTIRIKANPKLAVIVSGPAEAPLRLLLRRHLKPNFEMRRTQWRVRYRDAYPLVLMARPLRQGQDPEALYGAYADASVLLLASLDEGAPDSGFAATRDWCKAKGFNPVAWVALDPAGPESVTIDTLMDLVNYVNLQCPWPCEEIEDLDDYMAKSDTPLW